MVLNYMRLIESKLWAFWIYSFAKIDKKIKIWHFNVRWTKSVSNDEEHNVETYLGIKSSIFVGFIRKFWDPNGKKVATIPVAASCIDHRKILKTDIIMLLGQNQSL